MAGPELPLSVLLRSLPALQACGWPSEALALRQAFLEPLLLYFPVAPSARRQSRLLVRLLEAAEAGAALRVRALLVLGADVSGTLPGRTGMCALQLAAEGLHLAAARVLLDYGAAVEACDDFGVTSLMRAAWHGDALDLTS